MAKRSPAKQAELKVNYGRLREAGYSSEDAARLRSASPATIAQALNTTPRAFRQERPISERHSKAGGGLGTRYKKQDTYQPAAPMDYTPHKGRIKNSDYQEIGEDSDRNYENQWAYLMTYIAVDKYGVETRKYFSVLPDEKMNLKDLKQFVYDHCNDSSKESEYAGKCRKSSIQLIQAYHNSAYD